MYPQSSNEEQTNLCGEKDLADARMREEKEKKNDMLVISLFCEITTRLSALQGDRKKGAAIYKARYHRNWASLRQTEEEHHTWEVDTIWKEDSARKNDILTLRLYVSELP